jgi:hypothetical protein
MDNTPVYVYGNGSTSTVFLLNVDFKIIGEVPAHGPNWSDLREVLAPMGLALCMDTHAYLGTGAWRMKVEPLD